MRNGLIAAPLIGQGPVACGPLGSAHLFDGDPGHVLASNDPAYALQANFEFAALIRIDQWIEGQVFGKFSSGFTPDGWRLFLSVASRSFALSVADSSGPHEERCQSQVNQLELGKWHLVRAWHDGSNAQITVNGVSVNDESLTPGVANVPFSVGGVEGAPFHGAISRLSIWNRLLTAQERATIDRVYLDWPFVLG